jgi:hypothetical protein
MQLIFIPIVLDVSSITGVLMAWEADVEMDTLEKLARKDHKYKIIIIFWPKHSIQCWP